jgi:hypothetical protein
MAGTKPGTGETRLTAIVQSIRELFEGRSHAVGSVTLTTGAATTTVASDLCGEGSKIILTPRTANAAAEIGNGTMYVSSVKAKQFIITHANSGTTGRTFDWALQG